MVLVSRAWWRHSNLNKLCINILLSYKHKQTPNVENIIFLQTTRLFEPLAGLNSSLVQPAGELWPLAKMAKVTFSETCILPKICFLSHNFGCRNARKPTKGSRHSDGSLVSKTKLGIKELVGLALRAEVKTCPHYLLWHHPQNTQNWKNVKSKLEDILNP